MDIRGLLRRVATALSPEPELARTDKHIAKRITVGGDTTRVTDDRGGDRSRFGHTHASVGYGGLTFEF